MSVAQSRIEYLNTTLTTGYLEDGFSLTTNIVRNRLLNEDTGELTDEWNTLKMN